MSKILRRLSLLALLFVLVAFGLHRAGWAPAVMIAHALKTKLTRADPDYDELEAHLERVSATAPGDTADAGGDDEGTPAGTDPAADAAPAASAPSLWTAYRGSAGDGVYREGSLLDPWPEAGPPLQWRHPIGGGWASFALAAGRAVTIEQRRGDEVVVAYDLETGLERWSHARPAKFEEALGGEGPRATPVIAEGEGERWVIALGSTGNLDCFDLADGQLRWHRNVLGDGSEGNLTYGLSASPIVADGRVVVVTGAPGSAQLVHAFDLASGEPVWSALSDRGSYTTPMLAQLAGRPQLVVASASRVVGLDPGDGSLVWESPWEVMQGLAISQPVRIGDDRLLLSGGYGMGSAMLRLQATESGVGVEPLWRNTRLKAKFNSPVAHGGYVYGLDEGTLVCLDQEDGSRVWKGGRFGYGQMLLTGERLILLGESGELALVDASPDGYRELCRFDALEGTTWNVPALHDGRLLVRNAREMACFDLRLP